MPSRFLPQIIASAFQIFLKYHITKDAIKLPTSIVDTISNYKKSKSVSNNIGS